MPTVEIKLRRDSSLNRIIKAYTPGLPDRDIAEFLREFSSANEGIKNFNLIRKGTVVRVPARYLEKGSRSRDPKPGLAASDKKTAGLPAVDYHRELKPTAQTFPQNDPFRNSPVSDSIRTLLESLYGAVTVESGGLKFFSVGERSEISLDTSYLPLMVLNNSTVLVLDPGNILPEEIKQLVRTLWPEYTFFSYREGQDLRRLTGSLLESLGYSVYRDRSLILGGRSQLEYNADFVVYREQGDLMSSDIAIVSIAGSPGQHTPDSLVRWLGERDVNLIRMSTSENGQAEPATRAGLAKLTLTAGTRELIREILSLTGYSYATDVVLNLSDRKEYRYNLKTDFSIPAGQRKKVIELAELSEEEISLARKKGVDVACIGPGDDTKGILRKLIQLLGIIHADSPAAVSSYITPRNAKYRLLLPGIYFRTGQGQFFATDSELGQELLRDIIDPRIRIIAY
ncbi:MAG: hypothetical protein EPN25_01265 [Nitrospirae bacterium]|nr:MAG: hypothetical protein EPN25_01265 [Nitrospirota bacterium]